MSISFQLTTSGINGTTRKAWKAARETLVKAARQSFGDFVVKVDTQFEASGQRDVNRSIALTGFTVSVASAELVMDDMTMPKEIGVEAVNGYGDDFVKSVPVQVVVYERHVA